PPTNSSRDGRIVFENVSKFYGDVLGVNRVTLSIPPGITSLVGPNGSGKTTLMNLMTGLIQPTQGRISVLGISPGQPEELFRRLGYCTQFDSYPRGMTGFQFLYSYLRLFGLSHSEADRLTWDAIRRVDLVGAAGRLIAGYSKGMRQRIKLAQAISHNPSVLVLDEPLNGLDPLMRAETIALFRSLAQQGLYLIISSHVLHEVDLISDQVVLLSNGYVVAEGKIQSVRSEIEDRPIAIMIRCDKPGLLASEMFKHDDAVEVRIHDDRHGLLVKTRNAERFYLAFNHIVQNGVEIESVAPADDDVHSIYEYLIGAEEAAK
ncbi:MAG TPA: ABC transporter ATP-binding protein, partial [Terriglobia bacterium]|nr:ABC transporter ATP-binding protein [Terriglobia bacterium]